MAVKLTWRRHAQEEAMAVKLTWRLKGYDTFSGELYALTGEYPDEASAVLAGLSQLDDLEREQPSARSGGQKEDGIQDRVYVIRPDGSHYRLLPEESGAE